MTTYVDPFGAGVPPVMQSYAQYTRSSDAFFAWPEQWLESNAELLLASIVEMFVTVDNLIFFLPPADQQSVGAAILFRNTGLYTFNLRDYNGGAVASIAPGEAFFVYTVDNTTVAGEWHHFTYGTGTSAADAAALAGNGLEAASGKLRFDVMYKSISANYTVSLGDRAKLLEVISGSVVLTLPQASVASDGYSVFVRNSSAGSVEVDGYGTELVDGGLNKTLDPGESAIFICNGTYWMTVGFGRDATFVFSEFVVDMALGSVSLTSSQVAGKMIRLAGTASGNVTVTLPSVDNIYFVNIESGLGGFQAAFTTGSGTNVALTSSVRTALYCDGTNVSTAISTAVTSVVLLDDGSETTPSLRFALDTDTGIFRPGNNQIGMSSGGTHFATWSNDGSFLESNSANPALRVTQVGVGPVILLEDTSNPDSSPTFVDSSGNWRVGALGLASGFTSTEYTIIGQGTARNLGVQRVTNDSGSARIFLQKARGATIGAPAIVQDGDTLGQIFFQGFDGIQTLGGVTISAVVEGTPGVNDLPGALIFSVAADGTASPAEALKIGNDKRSKFSGDIEANSTLPRFDLYETDGGVGYKCISLVRDSNNFQIQTRNDSYGFISNDYLMSVGASGATEHRWSLAGTRALTLSDGSGGRLGIGPSISGEPRVHINGVATGSVYQDGLWCNLTIQSDVTSGYYGIRHRGTTQAASFTLPFMWHFYADQSTFGAGSTVTEQAGYYCANITGAGTNYGFYGALTNVAGRWNFYAGGTAPNYFAGDLYSGQTVQSQPGIGNSTVGAVLAAGGTLFASRSNNITGSFNREGTDGAVISMRRAGNQVGSISVTATATAYNTSSDYRLKENVEPITEAIGRVMLLNPSRFNFINSPGQKVDGFLAHEAQAVVPEAVHGYKDEVDEEGNPVYQGIDQSKLVPLLTAALQEAITIIHDLKDRVTQLENLI